MGCEPKGRWFNSQLGHMPRFQARFPGGGHVKSNHTLMFLSLPFPLSKNFSTHFNQLYGFWGLTPEHSKLDALLHNPWQVISLLCAFIPLCSNETNNSTCLEVFEGRSNGQ